MSGGNDEVFILKNLAALLAMAFASPLVTSSVQAAAIYTEVGDAGGTVATAQHITEANTRTIIGELLTQADTDMFGFNWATSGNFTIDALIPSTVHRTLALYDPSGVFVTGSGALAGMVVSNLVAGDYYLYIEGDASDIRKPSASCAMQAIPSVRGRLRTAGVLAGLEPMRR